MQRQEARTGWGFPSEIMKRKIRCDAKCKREAHSEYDRTEKSKRIAERLFAHPDFKSAKTILFYASTKHEANTHEMIEDALMAGKKVALPATDMKCHCLHIFEIKCLRDVEPGQFGILEPVKGKSSPIKPASVDLVIVPGLAFDCKGNRIGYGMGFYDSLLKQMPHAKAIALAFEFQLVEEIPSEAHDVRVHRIITEERAIECQ